MRKTPKGARTSLQIDLEKQIRRDLAPLGKVFDIRGTIEDRTDGVWFQDVTVAISVDTWRELILLHVGWDPERGSLVYRNTEGKEITLEPAPKQAVTGMLLERMSSFNDVVVSNGNRSQWNQDTKESKSHWVWVLTGLGALIAAGTAAAVLWGPEGAHRFGIVAVALFIAFCLYVLTRGPKWFKQHPVDSPFAEESGPDWGLILPEDWNRHPVEVFENMFSTAGEHKTFIEEMRDQCRRSGVVYEGFPRVSSLCYRDGGTKANRNTPDVQMRIPLVEFTGSVHEDTKGTVCYWDGERIWYTRGGSQIYPA